MQGVDAVALEAYEHFEVAKELGEKENRMILTKSLNHATQLRKMFKKEHILFITEDKVEEQVSKCINVSPNRLKKITLIRIHFTLISVRLINILR